MIYFVSSSQYLRFLRRADGVEAARKYFLDAIKSPSCTYHVYIAFATMTFCLNKDPKVDLFTHYVVYVLVITAFLFDLVDFWLSWLLRR